MTKLAKMLAAAALAGAIAVPATAQYPYPYPQPYPQQYPPYPPQYPYQTYPYGQPYGGSVIDNVIGSLLGNQYNVTDRGAISRCASAAINQAAYQYRTYSPFGMAYQNFAPNFRVTAITDVERRSLGLRVRGLIDSGYGAMIYPGQNYAAGDLTFRCTVDYRGAVSDVRVRPNDQYRRRY